jgi:hypothetical protein
MQSQCARLNAVDPSRDAAPQGDCGPVAAIQRTSRRARGLFAYKGRPAARPSTPPKAPAPKEGAPTPAPEAPKPTEPGKEAGAK